MCNPSLRCDRANLQMRHIIFESSTHCFENFDTCLSDFTGMQTSLMPNFPSGRLGIFRQNPSLNNGNVKVALNLLKIAICTVKWPILELSA